MPELQCLGQRHQDQSLPQVRLPIQREARGSASPAAAAATAVKKAGDTVALERDQSGGPDGQDDWRIPPPQRLLGLVKEVGGVKKFKDLLEAMSVAEVDQIPF